MTAKTDYLKWRGGTEVGCMFARFLARKGPERYKQAVEVIEDQLDPQQLARRLGDIVDAALANPDINASTLLFPALTDIEKLTRAALALRQHPHWEVRTSALKGTPGGDVVAVHIVRQIPFGAKDCPSEVLVLGPFNGFPPTRRAPVTAFELFVGEPMPHGPSPYPEGRKPTSRANVAHMPLDLNPPSVFKKMWDSCFPFRLKSLGGKEDSRAKAKVSFVISNALAKKLGCEP
jgi:hypothetical protein